MKAFEAMKCLGITEEDIAKLRGGASVIRAYSLCAERDELPMFASEGMNLAYETVRDIAERMQEGVNRNNG